MNISDDYKEITNDMYEKLANSYEKLTKLWFLSGLFMMLSVSINLINNKPLVSIILGYIASLLIFINAYSSYRKYKQYKCKKLK